MGAAASRGDEGGGVMVRRGDIEKIAQAVGRARAKTPVDHKPGGLFLERLADEIVAMFPEAAEAFAGEGRAPERFEIVADAAEMTA